MSLTDAQQRFALGDFDSENYSDKALFRLAMELDRFAVVSYGREDLIKIISEQHRKWRKLIPRAWVVLWGSSVGSVNVEVYSTRRKALGRLELLLLDSELIPEQELLDEIAEQEKKGQDLQFGFGEELWILREEYVL